MTGRHIGPASLTLGAVHALPSCSPSEFVHVQCAIDPPAWLPRRKGAGALFERYLVRVTFPGARPEVRRMGETAFWVCVSAYGSPEQIKS